MSPNVNLLITDDLLVVQAHLQMWPSHVPSNLNAAISWHAIREFYHVIRLDLRSSMLVLTLVIQSKVLEWTWADPPWDFPAYIGDLHVTSRSPRHG